MKVAKHEQWRKSFPYYKVQYWDNNVRAWHDIQRRFGSLKDARKYGITLERKYRVMQITRGGRNPVG